MQEIADLKNKNIRLANPAVVSLCGKGNKIRQVPIQGKTKEILCSYIKKHSKINLGIPFEDALLFCNQQNQSLSRWGISYIIDKYMFLAQNNVEFTVLFSVTLHVLRYLKAMGLLKAGINLIYIRDFLGHVNVVTMEIYARADNEMKRKCLEQSYQELYTGELPHWENDKELMH